MVKVRLVKRYQKGDSRYVGNQGIRKEEDIDYVNSYVVERRTPSTVRSVSRTYAVVYDGHLLIALLAEAVILTSQLVSLSQHFVLERVQNSIRSARQRYN